MSEPVRRRRWWPWFLLAGVGLAAVPVGLMLAARRSGDRELAAAQAETTAADPGWQLADLLAARDTTIPPPDQNAFLLVAGVEATLNRGTQRPDLDAANWLKDGHPANRLPLPAEIENLAIVLRELAEPLAVVHRAAGLRGEQPIPIPADPAAFDASTLPQPQAVRVASYAVMLETAAAAARNDPPTVVAAGRAGLSLARAVGDQPTTLGALVRVALAAVAARSAERVLAWSEPADDLADWQAEFTREAAVPLARSALRLERASFDLTMTNLGNGVATNPNMGFGQSVGWQFLVRPVWTADHAAGLRAFNRLLAELDRPPHQRVGPRGLYSDDPTGPRMTQLLLPALDKTLTACIRHEANMRVAATAVACERHRRQTGRWPVTLADLTPALLPAMPTDPFDGQPLRYKRTEDGVVVYSVGEDKADDGGKPLTRGEKGTNVGDVVFRLYDPAARRQPPAP